MSGMVDPYIFRVNQCRHSIKIGGPTRGLTPTNPGAYAQPTRGLTPPALARTPSMPMGIQFANIILDACDGRYRTTPRQAPQVYRKASARLVFQ